MMASQEFAADGAEGFDEDFEDDLDAAEMYQLNLSADALGFSAYPMTTDLNYGLQTPMTDAQRWSSPQSAGAPMAPPMEYTMSAPPTMMTMNMNNDANAYQSSNMAFY